MIGLDTNIIIRFLTQDDVSQSRKVNQVIEKTIQSGNTLWISHITLCQVVWVLERAYKTPKDEILTILKSFLQTKNIQVEHDELTWNALQDYEKSTQICFSDCLIGRINQNNQCDYTLSLDKKAAKQLKTFKFLE